MHQHIRFNAVVTAIGCALLLAGCGGGGDDAPLSPQLPPPIADQPPPTPVQPPPVATSLEVLTTTERRMESVAYFGGSAYLSLSNSKTEGTAVLKAALPLTRSSTWSPVNLGDCALGRQGDFMVRAPKLKMIGDDMWLMQPWSDLPEAKDEHWNCTLIASTGTFVRRDQGLRVCTGNVCETLAIEDIKQHGRRLYSNAGGGANLFTSDDGGNTWTLVRGYNGKAFCDPSKFHVIGERVLMGGECPLDMAYLEAYQLTADGSALASQATQALNVPYLENRNVQFIESVPGTKRVFIGVEGGLLRSDDNGVSFDFVIHEPLGDSKYYPYIRYFLPLKGKPDTIVIGGFDKNTQQAYLAWSKDGGTTWTDISKLIPDHGTVLEDGGVHAISSLSEDPQGRILVTMGELEGVKGKLMLLTLGTD